MPSPSFLQMKFQILTHSLDPNSGHLISDAYLHAWDRDVYPYFNDGAPWHVPLESDFHVSKDMVDELSTYLDSNWINKTVPTFYDLEAHFKVSQGTTKWDRSSLIRTTRYFFLLDFFDTAFWQQLLTPTRHPTEASTLTRKYDRNVEIYLN